MDKLLFPDSLLNAIGAWQKGWNEDQSRKGSLGDRLRHESEMLPLEFRSVSEICYRKRFLHQGELCDIVLADSKPEGIASWTTDRRFAEMFKGKFRVDAVSAAIFEHRPSPDEIVVNLSALWKTPTFVEAATAFSSRGGENGRALVNFKDRQGEVILEAPLRGSEIVALTGASSPFDELCDRLKIDEGERDKLFRNLIEKGVDIEQPTYLGQESAQRVISNTISRMWQRINDLRKAD